MCGIAGFYGNDKEKLNRIKSCGISTIKHRGPDSDGLIHWEDKNSLLIHTRLAIRDLSNTGSQPMVSKNRRYTIVYNGELYNTEYIKEKFLKNDFNPRGSSDTEIILESFARHGVKIVENLNGIFAFAIWDNDAEKMYVFRDPLGVKPLYYISENKNFAFSSEMKTLLTSNLSKKNINVNSAKCHIKYMWSPGEETIVSDIHKVLPGWGIIIDKNKAIKKINYKTFSPSVKKLNNNTQNLITECKEKVELAVKRQLISDVPVGFFLSGGVDSSAITSISKKILNEKLDCFTTYDSQLNEKSKDGFTNDYEYAQIMAEYLDANLHIVNEKNNIVDDIEKMIYHLDEPNADPACLNTYHIAKLSKEMGIKVLLGGTGADDLFTGYRRHTAIKVDGKINFLPKQLRNLLSKQSKFLDARNPTQRRIKKYLENIANTDNEKIINYFNWLGKNNVSNLFIDKSTKFDSQIYSSINSLSDNVSQLDKMLHIERNHFLTDHNLNYTDKMGMAHGVEIRVPYLDHDLVEFSLQVPHNLFQKKLSNKWILKESMKEYIPNSIINRPKTGFGAPLREWLSNELLEMKNELLSTSLIKKHGIFDSQKIMNLINEDNKGNVDGSYSIFAVMCINLWIDKFK
tara:strand:- start:12795 stop:14681 length:1887 start_codon:yes stop_codon:yes gene_type:complete